MTARIVRAVGRAVARAIGSSPPPAATAVVFALTSSLAAQPVLHVSALAAGGGNGLSWGTAFSDLQDAINAASGSGGGFHQIWVAQGTYRPDGGSGDRAIAFALHDGLSLYGGFEGDESSLSQRDPAQNPTILCGDIGIAGDPADNSLHVVTLNAFFSSAHIDGFTIRHGRADGAMFPANSGGGILSQGSITVRGCLFTTNRAVAGGGIHSRMGSAVLESCVFQANSATNEGGGAQINGAGTVKGCTFSGNNAPFGAGLHMCCSASTVRDCAFASNFGNLGGGLYVPNGSVTVSGCTFTSNGAWRGGGAYVLGTGSHVVSCFFGLNSAGRGGALYLGNPVTVSNCVVSRNFATESGAGVLIAGSASLLSTTVVNNSAVTFGGGVFMESGTVTAANSIFWTNADGSGTGQGAQFMRATGTLDMRHCCLQGWPGALSGPGSTGANPLLTSPLGADGLPGTPDDDVRLLPGSPCIDAGENASLPSDGADLDDDLDKAETVPLDYYGSPRRVNDPFSADTGVGASPITDMGASEAYPDVPADANQDGRVDFDDIIEILANWGGECVPCDADGNGEVGFGDITEVLAAWGIDLFG